MVEKCGVQVVFRHVFVFSYRRYLVLHTGKLCTEKEYQRCMQTSGFGRSGVLHRLLIKKDLIESTIRYPKGGSQGIRLHLFFTYLLIIGGLVNHHDANIFHSLDGR
jgi:hypothetical protein